MRTFAKDGTVWNTDDAITATALLNAGYEEVLEQPTEEKPKKKAVKGE